jgi:hypothetical protein
MDIFKMALKKQPQLLLLPIFVYPSMIIKKDNHKTTLLLTFQLWRIVRLAQFFTKFNCI